MINRWFSDVCNPTFEEFQSWMYQSSDGDSGEWYVGSQDFDLMVSLSAGDFEALLLDTNEHVTTAARQSIAELLVDRAQTRGGLVLDEHVLHGWVSGVMCGECMTWGDDEVSSEGLRMLQEVARRLLSERQRKHS